MLDIGVPDSGLARIATCAAGKRTGGRGEGVLVADDREADRGGCRRRGRGSHKCGNRDQGGERGAKRSFHRIPFLVSSWSCPIFLLENGTRSPVGDAGARHPYTDSALGDVRRFLQQLILYGTLYRMLPEPTPLLHHVGV